MLDDVQCSTQYFLMKITNKHELQQISFDHSSDKDFDDFVKIFRKAAIELYSFLVNDKTLTSYHPLHFQNKLIDRLVLPQI